MTLPEISIRNAPLADAKDLIEAAFAPLVTLTASDNEPAVVARSMPIYVRGIREATRECDFVASTDAIDSYDEVVDQKNWVLDRFMTNPVALWAHQSRELPIGTVTRCEVVNGKLECTIQFSTEDLNPQAEKVWRNVKAKVVRAVSVGFMPHSVRWEKRGDREVYVLADNELYEISVCSIPANPDCLAKMKARAFDDAHPRQRGVATSDATNSTSAEAGVTENVMNEKESLALFAAKDAEIAALKTAASTASIEKSTLEERATNAEERATKAEEERESALESVKSAETSMKDAATSLGAKTKEDGSVESLKEVASRVSDELTAAHVEKFVGVKITTAEKASFVKLAKTDRTLFDEMMAAKADLGISGRVIKSKSDVAERSTNGAELGDIMEEAAHKDAEGTATADLGDLMEGL
jgi:HK97 family phage prohead protease